MIKANNITSSDRGITKKSSLYTDITDSQEQTQNIQKKEIKSKNNIKVIESSSGVLKNDSKLSSFNRINKNSKNDNNYNYNCDVYGDLQKENRNDTSKLKLFPSKKKGFSSASSATSRDISEEFKNKQLHKDDSSGSGSYISERGNSPMNQMLKK